MLLTLLICVPVIDKVIDEWSHLHETHCEDDSIHFCKAVHHCPVCDYVTAANSTLPATPEIEPFFLTVVQHYQHPIVPKVYCSETAPIFQRGPPVI